MKAKNGWAIVIGSLMILGCEENLGGNGSGNGDGSGGRNSNEWLIPRSEVFDGGPGKDGIPALTEPEFVQPGKADYLKDDDLVLGYVNGDDARAYPHSVLDWHEIINDRVGDVNIAVTYCPLTGTGIGWGRDVNGSTTTFGVSGLLYNSNLIPYDRNTDSNWSQIRMDCVNGTLAGTEVETFPLVETTWQDWKEMYPSTRVVSENTGYRRDYGRYPYGNYRTNDDYLIFPLANEDSRLPNKARVHGVVLSGIARVYPLSVFDFQVTVIEERLGDIEIVVIGNRSEGYAVSFLRDPGDGTPLNYSPVQDQFPVVMSDQEGNRWDIFGNAVSGPREGARLPHARSFMGYWFSFAAFYPEVTIRQAQKAASSQDPA